MNLYTAAAAEVEQEDILRLQPIKAQYRFSGSLLVLVSTHDDTVSSSAAKVKFIFLWLSSYQAAFVQYTPYQPPKAQYRCWKLDVVLCY